MQTRAAVNPFNDLNTVSRVLRRKMPFHNLPGLAQVRGLAVTVSSVPDSTARIRHNFTVVQSHTEFLEPTIALTHWENVNKKADLVLYYPELPEGERLGMTLLALILCRGNTFAGWKIEVPVASPPLQGMAEYMTTFRPEFWKGGYLVNLKVPKLTLEEVSAVEWAWVNVLKSPAF